MFATDLDMDGNIDPDEITGIALGDKAIAIIYGMVNGDIVTNLKTDSGDLSGEAGDGSVLQSHSVRKLDIRDDVLGSIYTGRGLAQLKLDGTVEEIRGGTAASGMSFQFYGPGGPSTTLDPVVLDTNVHGDNFTKFEITGGAMGIYASDGGAGGEGGYIKKVKILNDADGVILHASNGGDSMDTSSRGGDGGPGGNVSKVKLAADEVTVMGGNGGDGEEVGGDGGWIAKIKFKDGTIGDWSSSFGVNGMGGLFAGRSGGSAFGLAGINGSVLGIQAERIAAIVASTDLVDAAPHPVETIKGIKVGELGANFDTDADAVGASEPAFDYFETIAPTGRYNLGEAPIDGLVIGFFITDLGANPLFRFETGNGNQSGNLDPH